MRTEGGTTLNHDELHAERAHLSETIAVIRTQLAQTEREIEEHGAHIARASREMSGEERRTFESLTDSDAFEEIANISQLAQPRAVEITTQKMLDEKARALRQMLPTPYFARIDMTFDDGGDTENVYIGRTTLKDDDSHDLIIHDWRAPISGVFYRFGTGRVSYQAPGGAVTGEVTRKRQYEIREGTLQYFFDADVEVQDEFLRAMLGRGASPRMRAIVETIQRDQDVAIRDTAHDLLMVQGAAGSGKTSVALHRAAYLMYAGLTAPLRAGDIFILSPNDLFERYIYGVLPELGEASAQTQTYERLLSSILGVPVESRFDRFERGGGDAAFKSSPGMVDLLDRFVHALPRRWLGITDLVYAGKTLFTREEMIAFLEREEDVIPLGARLARLEAAIWDAVFQKRDARRASLLALARRYTRHAEELEACARAYSILECAALARHIRAFTRPDVRDLYARLMSDAHAVCKLGAGLDLPGDLPAILARTRESLSRDPLRLEDAAAVSYLSLALARAQMPPSIKQVVVDEAQDYGALDYAVLNRCYPRARFTVLGDVNQALDRRVDLSLYEQIARVLNRRTSVLVTLQKSFRCTREILSYSLRYLDDPSGIESFSRPGEPPKEYFYRDATDAEAQIGAEIARLRADGMGSVALITETAGAARAWAVKLGVPLVLPGGGTETVGVFCIPLALSKGLEFDAVLILDQDRWREKRHLYVACTRALHRLALFSAEDGKEKA